MSPVEKYPNAISNNNSPEVKEPGIEIYLEKAMYRYPQDQIVLRGAFMIDDNLYRSSNGYPASWLTLVLVRRDRGGGILKILDNDIHRLIPPFVPGEEGGEEIVEVRGDGSTVAPGTSENILHGGYFNINLVDFAKLPSEQSSYWVEAFIGEHVSTRLEFAYLPEKPE
ncbi:MAG: hypothetical protein COA78_22990 [Blastopirellula sp.]|nr:MAG: hypothetical protein COA78_22990 [Blastopirellula sp.]